MSEAEPLLVVETDAGVVRLTRAEARDLLRRQLAGHDLVADLIADRRAEAAADNAAAPPPSRND